MCFRTGSAFILSGKHRVYLFEKDKKFGGHSNTITINKEEQQFKVDTGFIVYNDNNYPNFSKLLSHLNISSKWSDMSLGFSFNDGILNMPVTIWINFLHNEKPIKL